ncbi:uncharacterized protein N7482_000594 [Penicillium canariense]|uniref:Uncharacterized protein n=1 Tax=Penicillium canariense TaxID=189055 RepID=A0A9W9IE87_9EURO|nr:uncharacterized protein N7482_000594 [Penicillium canariense]KAJ5174717.1 hypothetical protein N7482_000594 [Penicillium canariense]
MPSPECDSPDSMVYLLYMRVHTKSLPYGFRPASPSPRPSQGSPAATHIGRFPTHANRCRLPSRSGAQSYVAGMTIMSWSNSSNSSPSTPGGDDDVQPRAVSPLDPTYTTHTSHLTPHKPSCGLRARPGTARPVDRSSSPSPSPPSRPPAPRFDPPDDRHPAAAMSGGSIPDSANGAPWRVVQGLQGTRLVLLGAIPR